MHTLPKTIAAVFLSALTFVSCEDLPPRQDGERGLVLYYPFNGNLLDSSGRGNHGAAVGSAYAADPWGRADSAYRFDGNTNFITVANSPSINPDSQLTIAFWLKVDSIAANYMPILVKGGPITGYFSNREYGVWTKQNSTLWYPQFKSAGDSSGMHELDSDLQSYAVGQWTHFVFIVDRVAHIMRIYSDGVQTHLTYDSYSTFNTNTHPLIVGWSEEGSDDRAPLRATMDNLRIYTRALSATEILDLYNARR